MILISICFQDEEILCECCRMQLTSGLGGSSDLNLRILKTLRTRVTQEVKFPPAATQRRPPMVRGQPRSRISSNVSASARDPGTRWVCHPGFSRVGIRLPICWRVISWVWRRWEADTPGRGPAFPQRQAPSRNLAPGEKQGEG